MARDFQSLGQALQSGNLSGAQQAFSQLAQDAQSASGAHSRDRAENAGGGSGTALIEALQSNQGAAPAANTSSLNVPA